MDPNTALATFRNAVSLRDLDLALELGQALTGWINGRGFLPAGYRTAGAVLSEVRSGIAEICNVRGVLRPLGHAVPR